LSDLGPQSLPGILLVGLGECAIPLSKLSFARAVSLLHALLLLRIHEHHILVAPRNVQLQSRCTRAGCRGTRFALPESISLSAEEVGRDVSRSVSKGVASLAYPALELFNLGLQSSLSLILVRRGETGIPVLILRLARLA